MRFLILALILFCSTGAQAESFQSWLAKYQQRAIASGVSEQTVRRALSGIELNDKVIALDRKQPEGHMTLLEYVDRTVTPARVKMGRDKLAQNRSLLNSVQSQYGVPVEIIVALWGKETDFGRYVGHTETISSLATLAYEGRRRAFFEKELLNAIVLTELLDMNPRDMKGSWAGAVGQCQFMPSNYIKIGVDGNRNGRIDLWRELPDVFASMANLLRYEGWKPGAGWGQKIRLPSEFDKNLLGRDKSGQDIRFWEQRGVRFTKPVPSSVQHTIRLYQPDGASGPAYALYPNFDVLMRWNRSGYFAVAVGRLADQLAQ